MHTFWGAGVLPAEKMVPVKAPPKHAPGPCGVSLGCRVWGLPWAPGLLLLLWGCLWLVGTGRGGAGERGPGGLFGGGPAVQECGPTKREVQGRAPFRSGLHLLSSVSFAGLGSGFIRKGFALTPMKS